MPTRRRWIAIAALALAAGCTDVHTDGNHAVELEGDAFSSDASGGDDDTWTGDTSEGVDQTAKGVESDGGDEGNVTFLKSMAPCASLGDMCNPGSVQPGAFACADPDGSGVGSCQWACNPGENRCGARPMRGAKPFEFKFDDDPVLRPLPMMGPKPN